jgi:hypothetical protein
VIRRDARAPAALGFAVVLGAAGAAALVAGSGAQAERARPEGRAFQRLVGGLGLGPSLDLAHGDAAFDPRVTSPASARFEPIPAGDVFETPRDVRRVP